MRLVLALTLLLGAACLAWKIYTRPPQVPQNVTRTLFRGIVYRREARKTPRPLVIHVVTINLAAPGLDFLVTPGEAKQKQPLRAQTTSQFVRENKVQLAINGDYFWPWHSRSPFDYYPRIGDRVAVRGIAASRGAVYSKGSKRFPHPTLYLPRSNRAQLCAPRQSPSEPVYNAVSGNIVLLRDGQLLVPASGSDVYTEPNPRTAVGLDAARKKLILMVVDGRQSGYSEGATLAELGALMREFGAAEALNMDGGGSSTLVMDGPNGPEVLNSPIDCNIPGRERAVANHLGVFAKSQ